MDTKPVSLEKEALFTTVPVGKAVITLAIPTVLSQLITVIYNMADTFFIGKLEDPDQVAAATLAMPLFILLTAQANLFGIGGSSLISRSLGKGDRDKAGRGAAFCIFTAAASALCYGLLVLLFLPRLLPILGADEYTQAHCTRYVFYTVGLGAMPTVLNGVLAHLIRAEGYSKQSSFGIALGGVLNILLDPLFIFVFNMGIEGAAFATMFSNVISLLYFAAFLFKIRNKSTLRVDIRRYSIREGIPFEVLSVGLPSFLISTLACFSNVVLNRSVALYTNEAVAGMGIAKKVSMMSFAMAQGLNQGTLPLIGYNYASGNRARMLAAMKKLLLYGCVLGLAETAFIFFATQPLVGSFIHNLQTVQFGTAFLRIFCLSCLPTMLNFFVLTVFQASGKKKEPIFLSMLRKGTVDVGLILLLNKLIGVNGIAWATPLSDMVALALSALLLLRFLRHIKSTGL